MIKVTTTLKAELSRNDLIGVVVKMIDRDLKPKSKASIVKFIKESMHTDGVTSVKDGAIVSTYDKLHPVAEFIVDQHFTEAS